LGIWFGERQAYHQYKIDDVFTHVNDFARTNYPEDAILHELIAIDYYLYFKIKPKIRFLQEVPVELKKEILAALPAHQQRLRHAVLPISFDAALWEQAQVIHPSEGQIWLIVYDGVKMPESVYWNPLKLEKNAHI
jgi:hypothetical protein